MQPWMSPDWVVPVAALQAEAVGMAAHCVVDPPIDEQHEAAFVQAVQSAGMPAEPAAPVAPAAPLPPAVPLEPAAPLLPAAPLVPPVPVVVWH